jgi:uncharacterized membrane protein YagU involved in acid resistance
MSFMSRRTATSFLLGGGVAGALDITYAFVFYGFRNGVPPTRILQSVASGLLGRAAFSGGIPAAVLGLFLHFLIAFSAAGVYFVASRYVRVLAESPVVCGALYGICIYGFMNLVVLPLSRFPQKPSFPPDVLVTGLLVHMFFIGTPIALAARRASGSG